MARKGNPNPNSGTTTDTNGNEINYVDKTSLGVFMVDDQLNGVPHIDDVPTEGYAPLRSGDFYQRGDFLRWEVEILKKRKITRVQAWDLDIANKTAEASFVDLPDNDPIKVVGRLQQTMRRTVQKALAAGTTLEELATAGFDVSFMDSIES